ncbi:MAG: hypothetical protein H7143_12255, partial [Pseudorhodobacter sp.]|nr:hypothetical protein [Rhizobacter sp.]
HENRIVMERYARGHDQHSLLNPVSIAKAVMSTLLGMPLDEDRINGLDGTVGMPVSDYLAVKLREPLGMEAKALWALNRKGGSEKAFCCLSATARDFARFGKLMRDGGRWDNRQIVPPAWAARNSFPGIEAPDHHTHQQLWWVPPGEADHPARRGDFYAYSHNGQYLCVNPEARLVIVKFSETQHQDPVPMFRAIADAVVLPQHLPEIERLDAPLLAAR